MGRLLVLGAILLGIAILPAVAGAQPVSARQAARAIHADTFDWGVYPPSVEGCAIDRYGTLCTVRESTCYVDKVFGNSVIHGHEPRLGQQDPRDHL